MADHLNLTYLVTLREFDRLGTLSAAAATLGYTPGAVSQQLATLERSVGVALTARRGRRLVLTEAGRALVRAAEVMVEAERRARQEVAAVEGEVAGPLTLGTWGSAAAGLLAAIVHRMAERYPRARVRSVEVDVELASDAVRRRQVDAAFGLDYPDAPLPRGRGVEIVDLHEEAFSVVLAADGPPRAAADVDFLAGLPWILPAATSGFGTAVRTGFRQRGFEPVVVHEVTDTAAALQLAAAGLGATVATPLMRRLAPALPLTELRLADPIRRRIVLLVGAGESHPLDAALRSVVAEAVGTLDQPSS